MSGSELHVAISGLVDTGPDMVKPQVSIVVQRDGMPAIRDQIDPEIVIKTSAYLSPAEVNAAVLAAATAHLADADGWNVAGPFNATFLYGGASPSPELTAALVAAVPGPPTITVAAQVGTARGATIQLRDISLSNLAKAGARVWISDAAASAPAATAPDGGVAISGGVAIVTVVANKVFDVVSSAAGAIVVTLTESGVGPTTWYVNVAIGNHVVSAAVAIAN